MQTTLEPPELLKAVVETQSRNPASEMEGYIWWVGTTVPLHQSETLNSTPDAMKQPRDWFFAAGALVCFPR